MQISSTKLTSTLILSLAMFEALAARGASPGARAADGAAKQPSRAGSSRVRLVPKVDERVELLSIVFRLAGNPEYNMSHLSGYTSDIDSTFAPYKTHPAVKMAARLLESKGVSFDAVMAMAVYLSPPPELKPLVKFSDDLPDSRWGKANAIEFVALLRDFYRVSKFHAFFAAHRPLYTLAESRFADELSRLDLGWYERFYGEAPKYDFNLVLGLNNGGGNYGPHVVFPDGREETYAIIGVWTQDSEGRPTFPSGKGYLATTIHEFNHSFINPPVDGHWNDFGSANRVFQPVAARMRAMAYGDARTMVKESLVRAAVIMYFESHGSTPAEVRDRIAREERNGFLWMPELCDLLRKYESNRSRYPTFDSFMPQAGRFYESLAGKIAPEIAEYEKHCPHVIGMEPFVNHAQDVDPSVKQLTVEFDKPLQPTRYSINFGPAGKDHYPVSGPPQFLPGDKAIVLPLVLKPDWSYSFVLTSLAFSSTDGHPLQDFEVSFKTR